jgi:hypothetical protein
VTGEPQRRVRCPTSMRDPLRFVPVLALIATTASTDSPAGEHCAVRLNVTANFADPQGTPVRGAELWYVDTLGGVTAPTQAWLVGTSDTNGALQADVCYMGELFYCAKRPTGIASIRFFVLKESYGATRLDRKVGADLLVKEGWALSGEACKGTATSFRIGEAAVKGYFLALSTVLRPVP